MCAEQERGRESVAENGRCLSSSLLLAELATIMPSHISTTTENQPSLSEVLDEDGYKETEEKLWIYKLNIQFKKSRSHCTAARVISWLPRSESLALITMKNRIDFCLSRRHGNESGGRKAAKPTVGENLRGSVIVDLKVLVEGCTAPDCNHYLLCRQQEKNLTSCIAIPSEHCSFQC